METKIVRDVAPRPPRSQSAGLCVHLFETVRLALILAGGAGLMVACSALVEPAKTVEADAGPMPIWLDGRTGK